jgi:hypothetical protein
MHEVLKQTAPLLPIVAGAIVAGLSALAKTVYERRDERLTAHRQLELATMRTKFVSEWLEVCRTVEGDPDFAASVTERARDELEEAYAEAQVAMANSRSVLSRSRSQALGQQLLSLLMLVRRRRALSYLLVGAFYFVVLFFWMTPLVPDEKVINGEPNPDYNDWWVYVIIAVFVTIVFRVLVGALVTWVEGRGKAPVSPHDVPTVAAGQ